MTSITTAWLVKLATRILRDKLAALNDDTERLLLRLEARNHCVEYQESENKKLIAQVTEYKENNLILGDRVENMQVELGKLRTDNDVLRRQLDNQAATIRDYQLEKENLCCTIDILQANVHGWSRVFATIEHQMGVSRETAVRLRREIDVFTVRSNAATGAGSASQTSDSAGGSTGSTADGNA